ncbi:hypothetical protein [Saccharopolyspora mangrovi]|uniref:Conjugal transfer protein n=1 Tax=Saccharopolyspora mangrovi TaxID=3082379 RepID=A0ABU6A914_9PSEU|nr:hypothetical protein [Saccharopolyspora sp. S2-29]MEB3368062.1 hypothetical protein [Saccharopolyspora sp. S2-29]
MSTEVARIEDYRPHRSGIYLPATATETEQAAVTEPIPAITAPATEQLEADVPATNADPEELGRTRRVLELEREVAEREHLAALQAQHAETHVESPKTLKLRQASRDAEDKRRELANPARIALRDARAQLWANIVGFLAALIALGWSTANVQHTAALGVQHGTAGWWLAWGVEPLISATLLTVMGSTAYLATRQVTVNDPWVTAAKWIPLVYTVVLNCWTSLPAGLIAHPAMELLRGLIVHSVGPAMVVLLVHTLPVLWAAYIGLHTRETNPASRGVQNGSEQPESTPSTVDLDRARQLLAVVRPAYRAGHVSGGVTSIRNYLKDQGHRVGAPTGQWIRDALKREQEVSA